MKRQELGRQQGRVLRWMQELEGQQGQLEGQQGQVEGQQGQSGPSLAELSTKMTGVLEGLATVVQGILSRPHRWVLTQICGQFGLVVCPVGKRERGSSGRPARGGAVIVAGLRTEQWGGAPA